MITKEALEEFQYSLYADRHEVRAGNNTLLVESIIGEEYIYIYIMASSTDKKPGSLTRRAEIKKKGEEESTFQ